MHKMVRKYHKDMLPYSHLTLDEIFSLIKSIPFSQDPEDRELLQRPAYTMMRKGHGGDCDDKSIALASYAYLNNIPYRFIAARKNGMPTLHHVYPELYIRNRWLPADPTYPFNSFGREREIYVQKVVI